MTNWEEIVHGLFKGLSGFELCDLGKRNQISIRTASLYIWNLTWALLIVKCRSVDKVTTMFGDFIVCIVHHCPFETPLWCVMCYL